jgi:hypothetical protein
VATEDSEDEVTQKDVPGVQDIPDAPKVEDIPELKSHKYHKKDINEMLQKVNHARGLAVARSILLSFGASRLSDLRDHLWEDFYNKCQEALNG